MSSSASKTIEPIVGYKLTERIGAGGYGEVWKAEAPGGLNKAIKFVFGQLDDVRATSEFQALNRIKQVRHPFLLSLERIEVVDGQLVIVTELADASFRDRHEECRKAGRSGIPRRELLDCLHDVADALDYMREQFGLQHLDVKPENLLLVGGRAKVADFGLVQDIGSQRPPQATTGAADDCGSRSRYASIPAIGGFTPLYASPEVFRGRPSVHSDQYSLAIVYQELLTGVLPFPGHNASQLANQHAKGRPQLASLPSDDQPTIARALAKDPAARFASCGALIAALVEPARGTVSSVPMAGHADSAELPRHVDTSAVSNRTSETGVAPARSAGACPAEPAASRDSTCEELPQPRPGPVFDLEPVEAPLDELRLRPTLWLGIGGSGATILRQLRRRLADRFGDLASMPAFRTLLLDTDTKAIAALGGEADSEFDAKDMIAAPLRSARHYRNHAQSHLQWLSRRWLYNIPRSLKTEGFRPIGRLAFADHATAIADQVRSALTSLIEPENLAATSETTGLEFGDQPPRVVIVASISGGTGSGMLFDAAALARQTLGELVDTNAEVSAVLTHFTGRDPQRKDLAIANALACLREWKYFQRNDRPVGNRPPLDHTYLIHLGNDLDQTAFEVAAGDVAAYLALDAVTTAATCLEAYRRPSASKGTLRTFGISQNRFGHGQSLDYWADVLARRVLLAWSGQTDDHMLPPGPTESAPSETNQPSSDKVADLCLDLATLIDEGHQAALRELKNAPDEEVANLLAVALGSATRDAPTTAEQPSPDRVIECFNALLGAGDPRHGQPSDEFGRALAAHQKRLAEDRAATIEKRLWQLAATPLVGIQQARASARSLAHHFADLLDEVRKQAGEVDDNLAQTETALMATRSKTRRPWWIPFGTDRGSSRDDANQQRWAEYLRLRLLQVALQTACSSVRTLSDRASSVARDLDDVAQQFACLAEGFSTGEPNTGGLDNEDTGNSIGNTDETHSKVLRKLADQMAELVTELQRKLHPQFLEHLAQLRTTRAGLIDSVHALTTELRQASRTAVLQAFSQTQSLEEFTVPADDDREPPWKDRLEAAMPTLLAHGGARRLLLTGPRAECNAALQQRLTSDLGMPVQLIPHPTSDVVLCCEAEQIEPDNVASLVIGERRECVKMASRLHTRIDIDWGR